MSKALVVGCNGQDGTFLCRHLLERGHHVVGVGRQAESRGSYGERAFEYVSMDLSSSTTALSEFLERVRPDLVFHVAAVHSSSGMTQYEPRFAAMLAVNVVSMHAILEYLRTTNPEARALYASSAKVFGAPLPERINERTPRMSACLYAITKNAAGDAIRYYRATHGCKVSQLFLFNHESELRPESFFIPKLARIVASAVLGRPNGESFATLDFYCDWGAASEYMDIAVDALERAPGEDFVLATGRTLHARELVRTVAADHRVDLSDQVAAAASAPSQPAYQVDVSNLQHKLQRAPRVRVETLLQQLVEDQLKRARS